MRVALTHILLDKLSDNLKFRYGTRFRDLVEAAWNYSAYNRASVYRLYHFRIYR
jgi:hypothetical protein